MALTPQWLDALRARITLSALIGRTVRLQKAGREFRACCPFHDEKSPSFFVNDAKGFYHCFGCQAHGDAIRWLTDYQGLAFMDAVKELASEAGLEVPAPDPRAARQAEQRAGLIDVTEAAQAWFVDKLRSAEGAEARAYLARRGISDATAREFGFGFAPNERQALKNALTFDEALLVEAGMRIAPDEGERENYDRFRGRLMLPIHNARGQVIAFGGRTLAKDAGGAKYLNSPDTPLFDKGRTLYNLHRAAPAARKSGRIVVVEGYMDVIALAQAGIAEAVAPMGTALTEHQLELLWRQVERPILCFDGDAAGQRAALKAIQRALPAMRPPRSLAFVFLPNNLDPDDYLRRHGTGELEKLLSHPVSLVDAIWNYESQKTGFADPDSKALLRERLIEAASLIGDDQLRKLYRRELIDRFYAVVYPNRFSPTRASHGLISRENLNRLKYFVEFGRREVLLNGVISALARRTHLIPEFYERLFEYRPQDEQVQFAIDVFIEVVEANFEGDDYPEDSLDRLRSNNCIIPFPFLKASASDELVRAGITEALSILIEKPVVETELEKATARYGETLSEEDEKAQAHWRWRKMELERKSSQFAATAA